MTLEEAQEQILNLKQEKKILETENESYKIQVGSFAEKEKKFNEDIIAKNNHIQRMWEMQTELASQKAVVKEVEKEVEKEIEIEIPSLESLM